MDWDWEQELAEVEGILDLAERVADWTAKRIRTVVSEMVIDQFMEGGEIMEGGEKMVLVVFKFHSKGVSVEIYTEPP